MHDGEEIQHARGAGDDARYRLDLRPRSKRLPDGAREIFVARRGGLQASRDRTLLEISPGTSKAQLHRARMMPRKRLMTDTWNDRLSEYLDGELAPDERAALESASATCRDCAGTLAELRTSSSAPERSLPRAPDTDLWPGVAKRIDARHALPFRRDRGGASPHGPAARRRRAALMVVSGGGVWINHGGRATSRRDRRGGA